MPFSYMGAKHGLARYYPPPSQELIIEPFAGAAGYSVYWSTHHKVLLMDIDPFVIRLWHELQSDDAIAILDEAQEQVYRDSDQVTNPFVYSIGCGLYRVKPGGTAKRSTMMVTMWPGMRRRIEAALPRIREWDIVCADYRDAPCVQATWFIDAPYEEDRASKSGNRYGHKARNIDYTELGSYAVTRPGQVIVCEQSSAHWLPFTPLRNQRTANGQNRTEMIWTAGTAASDAEQVSKEAAARRFARMKVKPYGPRGPYKKRAKA